jgi:hypothetical protein
MVCKFYRYNNAHRLLDFNILSRPVRTSSANMALLYPLEPITSQHRILGAADQELGSAIDL